MARNSCNNRKNPQEAPEKQIEELKGWMKEQFARIDGRFNMIDQQFGAMSSRIRELEADVRDISSIKGAVQRMGIGFQEIPYHMNGRSAVEQIKDYY